MITLRDYQKELVNKIDKSHVLRNCVQAATGFGKTVVFSYLANNFDGRVLILVNREELTTQTAEHLNDEEIFFLTAKTKKISDKRITIAMVETFDRRLKKGIYNVNDFDLIIADEVHNLQFVKCFEGYKNKLLGFTATPITDKKETFFKCKYCGKRSIKKDKCHNAEMKEFKRSVSLKRWYGELIEGKPISWLIDQGHLVEIQNYISDTPNLNALKEDSSGKFTEESEKEVFENSTSIHNLIENYIEHCKGKKTMIFNSNIKHNNMAHEEFLKLGYNVRSYDSKSKEDRKEIVEWFRRTSDAVLLSVGVFTTGFDVKEVQCIILNRATKSRALYYQMVGRGGRTTNKIFKPSFKLIDLGGNVSRFGSWDYDYDWYSSYNNEEEKQKRNNALEDFKNCHSCGAMIKEYPCQYCGAEQKEKTKSTNKSTEIAIELEDIKPPKPRHIINYARANNLDINEAKILTSNYIRDMFIMKKTPAETVLKNKNYVVKKIKDIIIPVYYELHNSDNGLEGNKRRTINDFANKVIKNINKYYGFNE